LLRQPGRRQVDVTPIPLNYSDRPAPVLLSHRAFGIRASSRYAQFLRDQVIAPVLAGIRKPTRVGPPKTYSRIERDYDASTDMPILVNDLGIETAYSTINC
jgi:hypothetical protein